MNNSLDIRVINRAEVPKAMYHGTCDRVTLSIQGKEMTTILRCSHDYLVENGSPTDACQQLLMLLRKVIDKGLKPAEVYIVTTLGIRPGLMEHQQPS